MCPICWLYRLCRRRIADRITDWAFRAERVDVPAVLNAVRGQRG